MISKFFQFRMVYWFLFLTAKQEIFSRGKRSQERHLWKNGGKDYLDSDLNSPSFPKISCEHLFSKFHTFSLCRSVWIALESKWSFMKQSKDDPWSHKMTDKPESDKNCPAFVQEEVLLEINIFGIKKNLYKKKLRVYFLKLIRRDRKFSNSIGLIKQMNKDVMLAKKV